MASLIVRNVDDELIDRLKARAAAHGRSAEAEHRELLRQVLNGVDFDALAMQMLTLTAGRRHTRAEDLLRASRDER